MDGNRKAAVGLLLQSCENRLYSLAPSVSVTLYAHNAVCDWAMIMGFTLCEQDVCAYLARQHGLFHQATAPQQDHVTGGPALEHYNDIPWDQPPG